MSDPLESLAIAVLRGERPAVAEALSLVENRRAEERKRAAALLAELASRRASDSAHLIGITGPPGVGKSSLAASLIRCWRAQERRVGVLAVDPSSPLSGGALLGDRLRMMHHTSDPGVFIRSIAGRGELGGLSAEAFPMSQVLLAAFDVVLVETIGVGQTEVDVVMHTDTTCFVAQPASGDMVQYLKAGILELPAVVAVNKADLGEVARQAANELRMGLPRSGDSSWSVPVLLISATHRQGIDELCKCFDGHRRWLADGARLTTRRDEQAMVWGLKRLELEFGTYGIERLGGRAALQRAWQAETDIPYRTLERLRERLLETLSSDG
jgi:LAO/AO transport system kinase